MNGSTHTEIVEEWDKRYDTYKTATAVEYREVSNALVIRVINAQLRGADLTDIFEVADVDQPFDIKESVLRVEVKVGWFGMKPKTTWSHLTLKNGWQLQHRYTGKVVHNLGKKVA
jgi:hypothetical protein